MKKLVFAIGVITFAAFKTQAQLIWVNEFHYDNSGTDTGEFFEIAAPSSLTDLASVTLTLYRGSDGTSYGSHKLSTFSVGSTAGNYTLYSKNISGIQNGAPDGFALDQSGSVLQFLSYEGAFQASGGVASGLTSTDIGVAESSSTASGASLGLTGTGHLYGEFQWTTFTDDSPGGGNSGQTFSAVPEPGEYALFAGLGLLIFAVFRRRWAAG
ncbi:MAG: PEP-CTERM sorting domain-containing protein [Verrucomicrobia bacterium]|nr:PEP-CTERM sorting domain-containing protein [Verrucomicrobiota bacterium]